MYPPQLVQPMREELSTKGFIEMQTPEAVDENLAKPGTMLLVVNSVCGCAAGAARPGVVHAVSHSDKTPDRLTTVFAGVDREAVNKARTHLLPYPPSSPCIALFKDGKLVHLIERHHIEGRSAEMISMNLQSAFSEFC